MFYFVASDKEGIVIVIIRTPADRLEVGRTLYTYYRDEDEDAMERVVQSKRLQWRYFTEFDEEQTANQGRGKTNAAEPSSFGKYKLLVTYSSHWKELNLRWI